MNGEQHKQALHHILTYGHTYGHLLKPTQLQAKGKIINQNLKNIEHILLN